MGLFGKKKEKVLDWSENYRIQKRRTPVVKSRDTSSGMEFLGSFSNSDSTSTSSDVSWDNDPPAQQEDFREKKTKLAKRLLEMTNKLEDLSNQIYHINQRLEVLERKLRVNFE